MLSENDFKKAVDRWCSYEPGSKEKKQILTELYNEFFECIGCKYAQEYISVDKATGRREIGEWNSIFTDVLTRTLTKYDTEFDDDYEQYIARRYKKKLEEYYQNDNDIISDEDNTDVDDETEESVYDNYRMIEMLSSGLASICKIASNENNSEKKASSKAFSSLFTDDFGDFAASVKDNEDIKEAIEEDYFEQYEQVIDEVLLNKIGVNGTGAEMIMNAADQNMFRILINEFNKLREHIENKTASDFNVTKEQYRAFLDEIAEGTGSVYLHKLREIYSDDHIN